MLTNYLKKVNKLKKVHSKHLNKAKRIEDKITNIVFGNYIDKEKRLKLIEDAQSFCYSDKKTSELKNIFKNFDKDSITYNIASDIIDAENHIKQHKSESFFSKIANVVIQDDDSEDDN